MLLALVAVFAVALFLTRCDKNAVQTAPYSLQGEKLLDQFNKNKFASKKGEYLIGKVKIGPIEAGLVDFFLTTPDGRYIHYVLETQSRVNLTREIERAEVLFLKRSAVVNNLDKKETILITVDDDDDLFAGLKAVPFDIKLQGYGLVRQENRTDGSITMRASLHCGCCITGLPSSACTQLASDAGCTAGGQGASSCSLSSGGDSCEVECRQGNACCWSD